MKIAIIGFSGSGKTSTSTKISKHYQLPVMHLDDVHFDYYWNERALNITKSEVKTFIDDNSKWVIEGNYFDLNDDQRFEEADLILILRFNRFYCFKRALLRQLKSYFIKGVFGDKQRPRFDFSFINWILLKGRMTRYTRDYERIEKNFHKKCVVFKDKKQLETYLDNLLYNNSRNDYVSY